MYETQLKYLKAKRKRKSDVNTTNVRSVAHISAYLVLTVHHNLPLMKQRILPQDMVVHGTKTGLNLETQSY